MNLVTILDVAAATFGLFSGAFFCVGVLHVEDSSIVKIATSFWKSGEAVATELLQQKADFIFGAVFLILSFVFQVAGKALSSFGALSSVTTSTLNGIVVGVGIPVAFVALLQIPYRSGREKAKKRIEELTKQQAEK